MNKVTHCPSCQSELVMSIQEINGKMRPLKKPWLSCPLVACRRTINTINGDIYHNGKLTKGNLK